MGEGEGLNVGYERFDFDLGFFVFIGAAYDTFGGAGSGTAVECAEVFCGAGEPAEVGDAEADGEARAAVRLSTGDDAEARLRRGEQAPAGDADGGRGAGDSWGGPAAAFLCHPGGEPAGARAAGLRHGAAGPACACGGGGSAIGRAGLSRR